MGQASSGRQQLGCLMKSASSQLRVVGNNQRSGDGILQLDFVRMVAYILAKVEVHSIERDHIHFDLLHIMAKVTNCII